MGIDSSEDNLDSCVAILWGVERGKRLHLWRMVKFMTQAKLGEKLGVSQQVIHSIESGRMEVCTDFTLKTFKVHVGPDIDYILFGKNADAYSEELRIKQAFWQYSFDKQKHKKRIAKRTNAEKIAIDGWKKTEYGLQQAYNSTKSSTSNRGNRTPGPRPKNKPRGAE